MADFLSYIGVGSNVCPADNVLKAFSRLSRVSRVLNVSSVWRSSAFGKSSGQADFLNAVWVVLWSDVNDVELRQLLLHIEDSLGRDRPNGDSWAPRTIDLDVIWWMGDPEFVAPDVRERPFVAVPLLEVAPEFVMPDRNELLSSLPVAHDSCSLILDESVTRSVRDLLEKQDQG